MINERLHKLIDAIFDDNQRVYKIIDIQKRK